MVGRVGLDDVGAHLGGEPHQRHDLVGVAVDLVAAAHVVGQHDQRLDHQRHAVARAGGAGRGDVGDALAEQLRLVGQHEEVHHHAGRVHLQRADDRLVAVLQLGPHHPVAAVVVGVAHVDAHDQRRLVLLRPGLQQVGLAVVHLDRVGTGGDELVDDAADVLEPGHEARLVADAVVDGDVEAAAVGEQAVHPRLGAHAHARLRVLLRSRSARTPSVNP